MCFRSIVCRQLMLPVCSLCPAVLYVAVCCSTASVLLHPRPRLWKRRRQRQNLVPAPSVASKQVFTLNPGWDAGTFPDHAVCYRSSAEIEEIYKNSGKRKGAVITSYDKPTDGSLQNRRHRTQLHDAGLFDTADHLACGWTTATFAARACWRRDDRQFAVQVGRGKRNLQF